MKTREDMTVQERIDAALVLAERICAECRPKPFVVDSEGPTILMSDGTTRQPAWGPGSRIESGPQSEAQFEEQMRELYPGWGEAE